MKQATLIMLILLIVGCQNNKKKSISEKNINSSDSINISELQYYKSLLDSFRFDLYPCIEYEKITVASNPVLNELHNLPSDITDQIINSFKSNNPDFNCRYKIITWGCGTGCQISAIFNSASGEFIKSFNTSLGIDYMLNSRLIILNPPSEAKLDLLYRKTFGEPEIWELRDNKCEKLK